MGSKYLMRICINKRASGEGGAGISWALNQRLRKVTGNGIELKRKSASSFKLKQRKVFFK